MKEEEREIVLARYGADVEMNTNLFLEPGLAKADMDIKLGFQKKQLERKLTDLGYECVMREGLNMVRCLADASPIVNKMINDEDKVMWMDRVYATTVFGALDRFDNAIANLLAMAKRAATMQSDPFDTMIVPSGLMELQRYAKADNVYYYLSGQSKPDMTPVKFGLDGGLHDPATNLNIFVHYPKADYSQGTAYGKASHDYLTETVNIAVHYPQNSTNNAYFMDASTGSPVKIINKEGAFVVYKCTMSSAILAASGSKTGELLMAYPQTSVNTIATSPEMMKLQLRVYLGACLYNPQNVMIIPHCHFEGVEKVGTIQQLTPTSFGNFIRAAANGAYPWKTNIDPTDNDNNAPALVYRGATYSSINLQPDQLISPNNGHFGSLDCPAGYAKLQGHQVMEPYHKMH